MSPSQIFALIAVCLITTLLIVVLIHLLRRRFKSIQEDNQKESTEFGVWYAGLIISAGIIFWQTVFVVKEMVDNVYSQAGIIKDNKSTSPFLVSLKSSFLLLGLGALWMLIWHFVAIACTRLILGQKDDREEMLAYNTSYFLVRAGFQITLSLVSLPFLTSILRAFLPQTAVVFYH